MSTQIVSGIYQIRNTVDGTIYIGSSIHIHAQWCEHRNCLRAGRHDCWLLQHAWIEHGESAFVFEIIEPVECKEDLALREQVYLDAARAGGHYYNLKSVGRCYRRLSPFNRK